MREDKITLEFDRILRDIKSLKIQGAENVARAGVEAYLLKPEKKYVKKILSTRPTEPLMQNAIKILDKSKSKKTSSKKFLSDLKKSHDALVKKGSKLIKKDMNIYTHCHSSSVIDILIYAKKIQKKNFIVYTTEVEPFLQGRKTAQDLSKKGIKVIVFPDLGAEQALKKCDLFLFGSDAYTSSHVVNKIGTNILCTIAKKYKVPCYSCGVSMKYTKKIKIEMRIGKEVWDERNNLIDVKYPSFDKTKYRRLKGIVSEFGILKPKEFTKKAKEKLKKF